MERHAKKLQSKAKKIEIVKVEGDNITIRSTTGKEYAILNNHDGTFTCGCKWSEYHDTRFDPCSHVIAVKEMIANGESKTLSVWASREDAQRQHRHIECIGNGLFVTERKAA